MAYVRSSLMSPTAGREAEVDEYQRRLLEFFEKQPGFVAGHLLKATVDSREVGRLTIWEDKAAADRAAMQQHVLSLRSLLHEAVEAGHSDRAFVTL